MTFPQQLLRATGRVVVGACLALATLWVADANPALGSRGGGNDQEELEDAGGPATTTTTLAPTTTTSTSTTATTAVPQTVTTVAAPTGTAGDGEEAAPEDPPVAPAADPAPVEEQLADEVEVAPATAPEPRATLPRTGAGAVAQQVALGLGLVGTGLAATVAGRRRRPTT